MAKYNVRVEKNALNELQKIYQSGQKSDIRKIDKIFKELSIHPREGIGKPERLRYKNGEFCSRQVNKKDRMVYEIIEMQVVVIIYQVLGHYDDKRIYKF